VTVRRERIHEDAEAPLAGSLAQCLATIPAPARQLNPVNTPIAYSGERRRRSHWRLKTMIKVSGNRCRAR